MSRSKRKAIWDNAQMAFLVLWNAPDSVTDHHLSARGRPADAVPSLRGVTAPRRPGGGPIERGGVTPCGSHPEPDPRALLFSLAQSPSRRHCCRRCRELTPTVSVLTCTRGPSAGSYFLLASYVARRSRAGAHPCCFGWQRSSSMSWANSREVPLARWPAMVYHAPYVFNTTLRC